MIEELSDPRRIHPSLVAGEREMLESWLEFHRVTLLLKCEGLDHAGRTVRPIPTSKLSLHGLVRHMALVELNWFRRVLLQESIERPDWFDPEVDDSELVPLDDADWDADLATWQQAATCPAPLREGAASTTPGWSGSSRAPCAGSTST